MAPIESDIVAQLQAALGPGAVLTGADVAGRAASWTDPTPLQAKALVRPTTTAEVATVLRLCDAVQQPVVTYGGGTNLVEGVHCTPADLVLSLERMAAMEEIDPAGRTLTVQAGAPLQRVQEAAAAQGLLFPLDLAARGSATIGGCAAMNAGGVRVLRYGVMRELVLGLEAVLADGTVVSSLNHMLKNNAGYDLKQLFIGSEGTLGVITRVVLRLYPAPAGVQTALVAMNGFDAMVHLLHLCQSHLAGALTSFEVMWPDYYALTTTPPAPTRPPLAQGHWLYVLVEAAGAGRENDQDALVQVLEQAQNAGLLREAVLAANERQRATLWRVREDSEQIERQHHLTFGFDVSLPLAAMPGYVAQVRAELTAACGPELRCWVYGHAADGNLHINVWSPGLRAADRATVEQIVYGELRGIGGSVSAEHGIGLEKKAYLGWCRSAAEIAVMRRLKQALDPHAILNPGRVFDL